MKKLYITPIPKYGYSHPIEEIILGKKKTTTRKTYNYPIGEHRLLAQKHYTKGRKYHIESFGVVVEITDINLITPKDITEEYAINDGIHPTETRTARENLLEILRFFYGHVPKEMVSVHLGFVRYIDPIFEDFWKKKLEEYRRNKNGNGHISIRSV